MGGRHSEHSWLLFLGRIVWPQPTRNSLAVQVLDVATLGRLPVHTWWNECAASKRAGASFFCGHAVVCHACIFDVCGLLDEFFADVAEAWLQERAPAMAAEEVLQ